MGYLEQRKFTENSEFQVRVKMSLLKAACSIVSEDTATLGVAQATKRYDLAMKVLLGSDMESRFIWACAAYYDMKDLDTDEKVDIAVASLWNGIAGIRLSEKAAL